MSIVSVKEIIKHFKDIAAVDGVTMSIEKGEIYGLLGPNGAGKTTLINLITNSIKRDGGQLYLFDEPINKVKQSYKGRIGIVPQTLAIYEDLTAYENVRFFASLYGLKGDQLSEKVEQALAFVGLETSKKQLAKTFSGGMKRRLNIACAIAHEPELIIMDEPTVGIDPQSKYHILESVKKLNTLGSTILYTTHLMEEAELLCTRVGIIDHGRMIAEGTVKELQGIVTDKQCIVIELLNPEALNLGSLESVKGVTDVLLDKSKLTIEYLKEVDALSDVMANLISSSVGIRSINMADVSLEAAFLSLTGRRLRD